MTFDWQSFIRKVSARAVTQGDALAAYSAVDAALVESEEKRRHPERFAASPAAFSAPEPKNRTVPLPFMPPAWLSGIEASQPVGDRV